MMQVHLQLASDEDFEWLLGLRPPTHDLRAAPDLAPTEVLEIIRPLPANWLIIADREVVGIIGIKSEGAGNAEIGYGIAPSRQAQGIATASVLRLLPLLKKRGLVTVTAETSVDNPASQRVLERSGFRQAGERIDDEDGPLILWERAI